MPTEDERIVLADVIRRLTPTEKHPVWGQMMKFLDNRRHTAAPHTVVSTTVGSINILSCYASVQAYRSEDSTKHEEAQYYYDVKASITSLWYIHTSISSNGGA